MKTHNSELSNYQVEGAKFLANRKWALLADDMGLGKSKQAVEAADMVGAKRILIICPAVARVNWKREFKLWSILDREFKVCENGKDYPETCSIVSYDYATEHVNRLLAMGWDVIIVDESHFIKEPTAKRTQAIYGKNGIIRKTERFWALSGTPAPNHAAELWPLLFTFGATIFSYETFAIKFCNTRIVFYDGKRQTKITGTKREAIPELRELLSSVMLRRKKEDVLKELPPLSFEEVAVEPYLSPGAHYDSWEYQEDVRRVEGAISHGILESIADSVSTLRRLNGLQKVRNLARMVNQELADNAYQKIVIFAIHREVIGELHSELHHHGAVTLYGNTSAKKRQESIDAFQEDPNCRVFIGNITAAGTAITLTASHHVLFAEMDWVPGNNAQAMARCHRRGQNEKVFVRFASIPDSIDEKITSVLRRKTEELTAIFDGGKDD